jgi:hypothetical protein
VVASKKAGRRPRGPERWLVPFLERRYTRLAEKPKLSPAKKQEAETKRLEKQRDVISRRTRARQAGTREYPLGKFESVLQPGRGKEILATPARTYWHEILTRYRASQAHARSLSPAALRGPVRFDSPMPAAAGIPGQTNWLPIGPSVVRRGQPSGRPAISGRAPGIAISPDGQRVYVATADGGVWRSDDAGATWLFTMENFDLQPTAVDATSLACGAIAIDPGDPDRVYLGTGEGDTNEIFALRLTDALPAYRGVGPLRSDDGGASWVTEPTDAASPTLVGCAFFALAVDPGDRDNVLAATNVGLYQRQSDGMGGYQWVLRRAGIHTSVVASAAGGTTTFLAAAWGEQVYSSNDGQTWAAVGTGFPTGFGRIGLAVQINNPDVVYAMVAQTAMNGNELQGIYRLDNLTGPWTAVSGAPSLGGQMGYDLTIAIDPGEVNTIYIGGQAVGNDGAVYRGAVTAAGAPPTYTMAATFIGTGTHADVHMLVNAPGDSDTLWMCCDGGVFKTTDATAANPTFVACNTGLGTLSAEYIGQHPTQPAVVFVGLQDNGTARYTGEECWTSVNEGDGGYCVVNWSNPFAVLSYADGGVYSAGDGGQDYSSWNYVTPPVSWMIMSEPLVGTPYNPASPTDANTVAFGAGTSLFISADFGSTWPTELTLASPIFALTFASAALLYVGTTTGQVFRCALAGGTWTATEIDDVSGGPLPIAGLVTDIEIDRTDASGNSIYLSFGGTGDYRHVWHFDGTAWQARSGTAGSITALLDVEHNALVVDPSNPSTVYVGADIGVWRSVDGGANWYTMDNGLPEAAVLDLQIHQTARLLRAALHGRGLFELKLDPPAQPDVQLYVRDTTLDLGLAPTVDGLGDPAQWPIVPVVHYESPNIKVDVPTPSGYQTPTNQLDFYVFSELVDGSGDVATIDPSLGTVVNRVYVEVHNRGIAVETGASIMLLLADASAGLQPLPAGYTANVQAGTPISSATWQTVGIKTVPSLRVGVPQIVEFDLPSTMLPPPASLPGQAHYCLLAIVNAADDQFTGTTTDADNLTIADRKVAQKNLHIVQFVGTPPPGSARRFSWVALNIFVERTLEDPELVFELAGFPGGLAMVVPKRLAGPRPDGKGRKDADRAVEEWARAQRRHLQRCAKAGRYRYAGIKKLLAAIDEVADQPLRELKAGGRKGTPSGLRLQRGGSHTIFLRIEEWSQAAVGDSYSFHVQLRDAASGRVHGGSVYDVRVVASD